MKKGAKKLQTKINKDRKSALKSSKKVDFSEEEKTARKKCQKSSPLKIKND